MISFLHYTTKKRKKKVLDRSFVLTDSAAKGSKYEKAAPGIRLPGAVRALYYALG